VCVGGVVPQVDYLPNQIFLAIGSLRPATFAAVSRGRGWGRNTNLPDARTSKTRLEWSILPIEVLSDESFAFAETLRLPTFHLAGQRYYKRHARVGGGACRALVLSGVSPDRSAAQVLEWLAGRAPARCASHRHRTPRVPLDHRCRCARIDALERCGAEAAGCDLGGGTPGLRDMANYGAE
jgi:hypothetical protein